jgi:YVTN family beta-propeller protein
MTSKTFGNTVGKIVQYGCLALAVLYPASTLAQQAYHVEAKWPIGGTGGWDYLTVDANAHRLYITHGTRLEVLDTTSGKSVGSITGMKGLHGVALDNDGKFGYISDGGANAVVVFDRASLQTLASIPAGTNPDGIAFEPVTKTVWAFNGRSQNVSVIDTAQRKVIATIALPGKPEFPAADGKGTVFANIEDKNEIVRLDAAAKKITATWPLTNCESPSGLAMDTAGRRLFSVCDGQKMAVTSPTIGDGPDAAAYDAQHKLAFSSNGGGTLTVVDASGTTYPVLQNLTTQRGARTMAFDSATGRIYLVTAEFGPRPEATTENPHPRPAVIPNTFTVLVVGRE